MASLSLRSGGRLATPCSSAMLSTSIAGWPPMAMKLPMSARSPQTVPCRAPLMRLPGSRENPHGIPCHDREACLPMCLQRRILSGLSLLQKRVDKKYKLTRQYYYYIYIYPTSCSTSKIIHILFGSRTAPPVELLKTISRVHSISTKDDRLPRNPMRRRIVEMLGMPMAR